MTWKYIGEGRMITGVPAHDLTDEEFEAAEARLDAQFGVKGSLRTCQHSAAEPSHACLLYEHVGESSPRAKRAPASEEE